MSAVAVWHSVCVVNKFLLHTLLRIPEAWIYCHLTGGAQWKEKEKKKREVATRSVRSSLVHVVKMWKK